MVSQRIPKEIPVLKLLKKLLTEPLEISERILQQFPWEVFQEIQVFQRIPKYLVEIPDGIPLIIIIIYLRHFAIIVAFVSYYFYDFQNRLTKECHSHENI